MKTASNLVLVGPMGAGKSSIGRQLAKRFGLRFIDADHEVETRTGVSIATIFDCEGEAGFRLRERATLASLLAQDACLIATGGGAVLDADTRSLLRERGFVVHLHADVSAQLARLARDRSRPLLMRDDREQALHDLARIRQPLYAQVADLRYDTTGHGCGDAVRALTAILQAHWRTPESAQ